MQDAYLTFIYFYISLQCFTASHLQEYLTNEHTATVVIYGDKVNFIRSHGKNAYLKPVTFTVNMTVFLGPQWNISPVLLHFAGCDGILHYREVLVLQILIPTYQPAYRPTYLVISLGLVKPLLRNHSFNGKNIMSSLRYRPTLIYSGHHRSYLK